MLVREFIFCFRNTFLEKIFFFQYFYLSKIFRPYFCFYLSKIFRPYFHFYLSKIFRPYFYFYLSINWGVTFYFYLSTKYQYFAEHWLLTWYNMIGKITISYSIHNIMFPNVLYTAWRTDRGCSRILEHAKPYLLFSVTFSI